MIEGQFKPFQKLQFEQFEDFVVGGIQISHFASANSTSQSITWPASIQAGDVAFLADHANDFYTPSDVVPAGFTKVLGASSFNTYNRVNMTYKILLGSETGSLNGMSGSTGNLKVMHIFRGSSAITGVTTGSPNVEITGGNPSAQVIAASAGIAPLVVLGSASTSSATTAFSTTSPAWTGTANTTNTRMIFGYTIYNSGPLDHTIDMNDQGNSNTLMSYYAQFS